VLDFHLCEFKLGFAPGEQAHIRAGGRKSNSDPLADAAPAASYQNAYVLKRTHERSIGPRIVQSSLVSDLGCIINFVTIPPAPGRSTAGEPVRQNRHGIRGLRSAGQRVNFQKVILAANGTIRGSAEPVICDKSPPD
jgi:hypothetical protein